MSTILKERLESLCRDPNSVTEENLQSFMSEITGYLMELKDGVLSQDPKAKEKALNTAAELKTLLKEQIKQLSAISGLDLAQLANLPSSADKDDIFEKATQQLTELTSPTRAPSKKSRKTQKINLMG